MTTPPIREQDFLRNIPLFRELAPDELDRIALCTRQQRSARGEILFHRGDPAAGMHVIVVGQIKLAFASSSGDEKVVDILGPGQSFGEAVMFLETRHVVSAHALADSLLLFISREAIFEELERDPKFARRVIGGLARRLHYLMNDLEAVSMRSGTERLIGYLLSQRAITDRDDKHTDDKNTDDSDSDTGPLRVTLPATKGMIASRLNLTQEHFSRILHELVSRGMITVKGRDILILDVGKLKSYTS